MSNGEKKGWGTGAWIGCGCAGCLLLVVLFAAGVAGIGGLALFGIKKSDVYTEAMARVRASPEVIAALGEPIEPGLLVSGSLNLSTDGGTADLSIPISGPEGKGTVFVVAEKPAGAWEFSRLEVRITATEELIDLLASPLAWHLRSVRSHLKGSPR